MTLSYRPLAFLGFLVCVGAMAFALFMQYRGYEPCPMCIFQRVAMIATGLIFLVAALHAPRARGRGIYAFLGLLSAGAGAGIAGRHVWLQHLPPDQVPACGPTLDYLLDVMPLKQVIETVLRGDGNCAVIDAQWLGISLPGWTLIGFLCLMVYCLAVPILSRGEYRNYL